MSTNEKIRVDKYLWAIRVFKTRSQASDACDGGKVKLNGNTVKAAKPVAIGDKFEVKTEARKWVIEVVGLIANRVAYTEAVKYYVDTTPEEDKLAPAFVPSVFQTGKRQTKIGRPTKKDRRNLDDFMGTED